MLRRIELNWIGSNNISINRIDKISYQWHHYALHSVLLLFRAVTIRRGRLPSLPSLSFSLAGALCPSVPVRSPIRCVRTSNSCTELSEATPVLADNPQQKPSLQTVVVALAVSISITLQGITLWLLVVNLVDTKWCKNNWKMTETETMAYGYSSDSTRWEVSN